MRGPTYILKKKHLEQEEKREYQQHVMKLKNIQGMQIKGGLIRSISVDKRFVEDKEMKKTQNRLFKEDEEKRQQKLENKALISKLEAIQKGKYSIMRNIKDQSYKESVQYLSNNQAFKSGINFQPHSTQKTRLRTMTANTESSRNIQQFLDQNQYDAFKRLDQQYDQANNNLNNNNNNKNQSNDARFFNNTSGHIFQSQPNLLSQPNNNNIRQKNTQSQQFDLKPNTQYNQNFNNDQDLGDGKKKNSKNNINQGDGNNNGKNQNDDDPSLIDFNNQPNNNIHNINKFNNNNNIYPNKTQYNDMKNNKNKENDNQNQPKIMKTEGNQNDDDEEGYDDNNPNTLYNNYGNNGYNNQNEYYPLYDQRNQGQEDRIKSLSRDGGKRRRINSSINLASLNKHVAASIERQKEQERIALENNKIVQRMMKLPPVIPTKSKLKQEFKKQKQLKNNISKFHEFQERKIPKYLKNKSKDDNNSNGVGLVDGVPLDEKNQELMDQRIHLVINVKEIAFVNFLPISTETEKYYMQVQASIHEIRRTNPEVYADFSKSVINEFFYLKELKQNRIVYLGLYKWTPLDNGEHFLGDFELDLTPYYLQSGTHQIHYDLRNYKQKNKLPNYMVKDMRKKGWIDIEISVRSSVKQYLLDLDIIKKDHPSQEPSYLQDQSNSQNNPAQSKKNSDHILQLMNQNQIQQTQKQQKLNQLKQNSSINNNKGQSLQSFNSQNNSINIGNKQSIGSIQQNNLKIPSQSRTSLASNQIHSINEDKNSNKNINNSNINKSQDHKQKNTSLFKDEVKQDEYDYEQFEKENSSNQNANNTYDQDYFFEQDDDNLSNKNNHNKNDQGQKDYVDEEIEL